MTAIPTPAEPPAAIKAFYAFILSIVCLHYYLRTWIYRPTPIRKKLWHQAYIIGDDFALGFGDTFSLFRGAGVAAHIQTWLGREPGVRQNWQFLNHGVIGSVTSQWINEDEPKSNEAKTRKGLVNPLLSMPADVVLIMLGSEDILNHLPAMTTVNNLKTLARQIARTDKRVYVATIPLRTSPADECNVLLRQWLATPEPGIYAGPDLANYEFNRRDFLCFDKMHFNAKGYSKMSEAWVDILSPDLTRLELNHHLEFDAP